MFGLDPRAARVTWTVLLVCLTLYLAYLSLRTIVVFALALFLSHLIHPVVAILDRLTPHKIPRTASIAIAYALILTVVISAGAVVGSTVAEQAAAFASQMPELIKKDPIGALPLPYWLAAYRPQIETAAREQIRNLDHYAIPFLQGALGKIVSQAGNLLSAILIPILAFFFLADDGRMHGALLSLARLPSTREVLEGLLADIHTLLSNYMRALVGLALSTLFFSWLFLQVTGVPYAVLLAAVGAMLEFIPLVGPLVAGVTTVVVAGAAGYDHVAWIIVFLIVFRIFQDYVVSPYLMGQGVELHPLAVLFGVLAGEQIGGVAGMFFSIPVLAALRIVFLAYRKATAASRMQATLT